MTRTSLIVIVGVIVPAIALAGCENLANRSTIDRTTTIPQLIPENKQTAEGSAVAIHLDAQQRLVLATAMGYCAEPSPDALSAYVATLALGATTPSEAAASFASALQGSTASIGLRTQSITLMRDALYRMCEAANNDKLDGIQVARFLRRSQDLTAVVLAIEQLTGVVAANQVTLTGESSSDASANLVANQQLLDQAKQTVQTHKQAVKAAQDELAAAKVIRDSAKDEYDDRQAAYQSAQETANAPDSRSQEPVAGTPGQEEGAADSPSQEPVDQRPHQDSPDLLVLEADAKQAKSTFDRAEEKVKSAETHLVVVEQRLRDAEEVLKAVETARNVALTKVTSDTRSSGQFSSVVERNKLDPKSTEAIAKAVSKMVEAVIDKKDTAELCVSYVISDRKYRQEQSEERQLSMAAVIEDLRATTAATESAKRKAAETGERAIAAEEAHRTAIAELEKAQYRANKQSKEAKAVKLKFDELKKTLQTSAVQTTPPQENSDFAARLREAAAAASDAVKNAEVAKRDARQAEAKERQAKIALRAAKARSDLALAAVTEEQGQLNDLRVIRAGLARHATTAPPSGKIGDVAESICQQVILAE